MYRKNEKTRDFSLKTETGSLKTACTATLKLLIYNMISANWDYRICPDISAAWQVMAAARGPLETILSANTPRLRVKVSVGLFFSTSSRAIGRRS